MFKVETHDNSYDYFNNINLDEGALHITSNLSLEKLLKKSKGSLNNEWKIKSIEHLLEDIYPKLNDLIHNNKLKIILRSILISNNVDKSLMQEQNIKILFSDFMFLIQSGIRYIPEIKNMTIDDKVIISIFNEFVKSEYVKSIIKEVDLCTNFKNKYSDKNEIKKIYLYNFNNLYLSRMVFFYRLKHLGYEVIFRIPKFGIDSIDEPWINLYSNDYFHIDNSTYKRYKHIERSTYIDYICGNEIKDDDKNIVFKEFIGSFEFKKELEGNKEKKVSYYALDINLINQIFDIDKQKEYNMPLVKFISNIYNCKFKNGDIFLNYNTFIELITSGWIEIKEGNRTINGVYHLDFIKNIESYFDGIDSINNILNRIEHLRYLKLASDTIESEVKQKIGKNKVKRFLSNPFRCISYVNTEDYDITILQFKSLVERLRYILKTTIKREDDFIEYNKNNKFLKEIINKNTFISSLKEDDEYKDIIDKIYQVLNYENDIEFIYSEDAKELVSILINKTHNEDIKQVLPIDTIDGDWQRDTYDEVHITDLSFKAYQAYLDKKKSIGKYINHKFIYEILQTDMYNENIELKNSLNIAKKSVKNVEQFFNFDIANLLINYNERIVFSYIKNLRSGDSESILLRILKNLYKVEIDNDSNLLDYLDGISEDNTENEDLIIADDILNKHKLISPVGYRDLDFCYTKFIYSNLIESNVIYESDFHHKLVFSRLISLFKHDIPNYEENIKRFLFPIFPQWNYTTKENMVITNFNNLSLKDYNLYENINYPKNIDKLQILMSKYIVTEKYKVKNRYEENKLDTEKLFSEFIGNYLNSDNLSHKGRHCTMCPYILICEKGEYSIERNK